MRKATIILAMFITVVSAAAIPGIRDEICWLYASLRNGPNSYLWYRTLWPEGHHAVQARMLYDRRTWEESSETNSIESYETYLEKLPDGHFVSRAAEKIEDLIWQQAESGNTVESYEHYISEYPSGKRVEKAREYIELIRWRDAVAENSIEVYRSYQSLYPSGQFSQVAGTKIDELTDKAAYLEACEEDWYSVYQKYIRQFPNGNFVQQARDRISWLRAQRALVEIDYPPIVDQGDSPYSNVGSPFFGWSTVFREKGGKIGYRVEGEGYIYDVAGDRWGTDGGIISRNVVRVPPGGRGADYYWCSSKEHHFCNGRAQFTWKGEDAGGHQIEIHESVFLRHKGCTAAGKR
jgi:hypothetical protein